MANGIIMTISLKYRNKLSNLAYLKILKCAKLLDLFMQHQNDKIGHNKTFT